MKRARRWWLNLHLCLGLALGGVFALLGVTGSVLAFYPEIDRALNPGLRPSTSLTHTVSVEAVVNQLRRLYPERDGGWRIELPLDDSTPITARYAQSSEREGRSFSPLMLTLDPVTLERTSHRVWGDYLATWIYDLHYTLLFDKPGKVVVGTVGLVMLISLLSGLWLWWPSRSRWWSALRPVIREGSVRRIYDLHVLAGTYGVVLLIVLALTGAGLALPDQTRRLLDTMLGLKPMPEIAAYPVVDKAMPIDLDRAVAVARERFPEAELRWVDVPAIGEGPLGIRLYQSGEAGRRFPKTRLWLDPYSEEIIAVHNPAQNTAGNTVLDWLHPLHNGEAFGLVGRWMTFFSGFVPLLLFVTGYIRWRQKRQAKRKAGARI
ncbi:MAG: hypothetical protein RL001_2261 [Pseudomonadota bacterium]|jgi:uncharacterized iron-regulated membrane protein|nr:PepSY domain-containing protein [Oxalobacteraceae bacterium]